MASRQERIAISRSRRRLSASPALTMRISHDREWTRAGSDSHIRQGQQQRDAPNQPVWTQFHPLAPQSL